MAAIATPAKLLISRLAAPPVDETRPPEDVAVPEPELPPLGAAGAEG